jgi:hypothetical protein
MSNQKWNGYVNCEKQLLTKQHLENILNDVFKNKINTLQKKQREVMPPINSEGKFERFVE